MTSCTIQGIRNCSKSCVESLLTQLREKGFAVVSVDDDPVRQGLKTGVRQANRFRDFRFPPITSPPLYTPKRRQAFRSLYDVAASCFNAIISEHYGPITQDSISLEFALEQWEEQDPLELFSPDCHKPFQRGMPFAQSFFNLFNYDWGMLNPHVDRGLVTVVYSSKPVDDGMKRSRLWVEDRNGEWRDADQAASPPEKGQKRRAIIFVGEDLVEFGIASTLDLFAAKHAVKVDPLSGDVSRAHFRTDPEGMPDRNRRSAALVLRHDPVVVHTLTPNLFRTMDNM